MSASDDLPPSLTPDTSANTVPPQQEGHMPRPVEGLGDTFRTAGGRVIHLREPDASSPTASGVPVQQAGRYLVRGEVGRGGMGMVLRGEDPELGREVAIKVLLEESADSPDVAQRFREEAQVGGQLQHPGVVPVYELGRFDDGRPFFTMKLVRGVTLAKL